MNELVKVAETLADKYSELHAKYLDLEAENRRLREALRDAVIVDPTGRVKQIAARALTETENTANPVVEPNDSV